MSPKHIPQRTCVACGRVQPKRALVRIVRTPDAGVVADETGKRSGRGAYLCRRAECWDLALRRDVLDRALQKPLTAEEKGLLQDDAESVLSRQ